MAGVPTGRCCDACRKQKKKCDQAKPACVRCIRLKVPCIGSGVRRFMFKSENLQAAGRRAKALVAANSNPAPSAGLSNKKTLIAGSLIHIIELRDPAYDISTYGWFIQDLPRRVCSRRPLSAAITAFKSKFDALDRYVFALKTLRESVQNPARANSMDNMCSICLIAILLGHLLQSALQESRFDASDRPFMQTILTVVVIESFVSPNVELVPWFWQAFSVLSNAARPLKSGDGTSFASLDIETIGEMSCCTYSLIQMEQRRVIQAVKDARRVAIRFHTTDAVMLTIACVLNRILRSFHDNPALIEDAKRDVNKNIQNRPIAAASTAIPLIVALASVEDYRHDEVETLLQEYQTDFLGLHYFDDVKMAKRGFKNIDRSNRKKLQFLLASSDDLDPGVRYFKI
ncbi:hypothetical protein DER46DRAFT_689315 [Fusarium sp. MPI-SDFR-AT-0072]|nr:hypothetical protein DER46DRAFT_689315 [Fusarium sp. MPI-SDFR-AT-0072]